MLLTTLAVALGFGIDLLAGDPDWLPHPVRLMGKAIAALEKMLRGAFPTTRAGERAAGFVLAGILPLASFAAARGILFLFGLLGPIARLLAEAVLCWQMLAARSLSDESRRVYDRLSEGDLPGARAAVARIVGRDTDRLTAEGVTRAAVETVAENTCDGVAAPLLFMALGGAPLALLYKAVNTMDSMVGYQNERYRHFGFAAAKLDDLANFLPSRIAALAMIAAAPLVGLDAAGAWRIWRRDRRNHKSPNSAQTEAACAGALGVRLAGDAWYFGALCQKPTIGDALRPVEPADILRAGRLMFASSALLLVLCLAARLLLL